MAKLTLTDLASLTANEASAISTLNSNFADVETAVENTLSRDGTSPNSMAASLDMDSNTIINLPAASTSTEPVRKAEFDSTVADLVLGVVPDDGVGNTILANMAQNTIKGRITAGTGDPEDLTATQVRTIINVEDGAEVNDTASEILTKLLTVDGSSSGLDADLVRSTTPGAFGLTLLAEANLSSALATLSLEIGTDVQAWDAQLDDLAGLTPTKGNVIAGDGSNWISLGVGTNGQALLASSGETSGLVWGDIAGGIGGSTGATDNRLVRSDGTGGSTIQSTGITVNDSDDMSGVNVLTLDSYLDLPEISEPSAPSANTARVFAQDDGSGNTELAWKDNAGTVRRLVPAKEFLAEGTFTGGTEDIDLTSFTDFTDIEIHLTNVVPSTDDVELWMRTSTDGGSTFDNGASDYIWIFLFYRSGSSSISRSSDGAINEIVIAGVDSSTFAVSNTTSEGGVCGRVVLHNPFSATETTRVTTEINYRAAAGDICSCCGTAYRDSAADVDAVRFQFESGNFSSGSYRVYGLR